MRRLKSAAAYLAASALLVWLSAWCLQLYQTPRAAAEAYLEGSNLPQPSVEVMADDREGKAFAAAGSGYYVEIYTQRRLGAFWGTDSGIFYPAEDSVYAEVFSPAGCVMGTCGVPGAVEASFELYLPGEDGTEEAEYMYITVPLDGEGCFRYDYGGLFPPGETPLTGYAEARDAGGDVLCDNGRARIGPAPGG